MTLELLNKIFEENNIPKDVVLLSDSGWECSATDMNGVFYSSEDNEVVITQGCYHDIYRGYHTSYNHRNNNYKLLYVPDEEIENYADAYKLGLLHTEEPLENLNIESRLREKINELRAVRPSEESST